MPHLKIKQTHDLPPFPPDDNNGLRHFNQQLKDAVTWLISMGSISSFKYTGSLIKAVSRYQRLRNKLLQKICNGGIS